MSRTNDEIELIQDLVGLLLKLAMTEVCEAEVIKKFGQHMSARCEMWTSFGSSQGKEKQMLAKGLDFHAITQRDQNC